MYCFLTAALSVLFWLPSHIVNPAPFSSFVVFFSADTNSSLGLIGTIALSALLLLICVSLIIIAWDTCRPAPPNRRSQYLEFDPTELETNDSLQTDQISSKKTLICYGLGIFCLYVLSAIFISNFRHVCYQILLLPQS